MPHTTRPPRSDEVDGLDYFFVSRAGMEQDLAAGAFAETVRFQGNLYGTSFKAIESAASTTGHCLLDISDPHTVHTLKAAGVHPISIFLRPASVDAIVRQNAGLPVDAAHGLFDLARMLEEHHAADFSAIVPNDDLQATLMRVRGYSRQPGPRRCCSCLLPGCCCCYFGCLFAIPLSLARQFVCLHLPVARIYLLLALPTPPLMHVDATVRRCWK